MHIKDHVYPARYWNPDDGNESVVAKNASEVPEGWMDHHPASHKEVVKAAAAAAPKPAEPCMSKAEVTAALDEGGFEYAKNKGTKALLDLLDEKVRVALKEAGKDIPEGANTKQLYELLTKPE